MPELRRCDLPAFVVREIAYPAGAVQPRHEHDFGNITAVIRGEMLETADGGEHRGRSCSIVVKPAGTPHANRIIGRTSAITVAVQFARNSPIATQLGAWRWIESDLVARAALALQAALHAGANVEERAHDFVETVLAIGATGGAPCWFAELRAILDRDFAEPLHFRELARQLGMHPVYVSRAFQRYAGLSMRNYVRARRLAEARHLLGTTQRTAAAIALDTGFADASHLSRTFAQTLGLTPRAFRKTLQG